MFVDRRTREGRFLEWKAGLFSVAAVLSVVGFYFDERWMIGVAGGEGTELTEGERLWGVIDEGR